MELDDLKYQLINKLASDHSGRQDADIASLLNKQTVSITGRLKKNLRFEVYSCVVLIIMMASIGSLSSTRSFRVYFSVFAILSLAFLVQLIFLLRRTNKLSDTTLPVKANLQSIVILIEKFTRRYFRITMGMLPVCLAFILVLLYTDKPVNGTPPKVFHLTWRMVSFIVLYMGALSVAAYYFTKWYLNKLFGKYVIRLRACIAELEE